MSPGALSEGVHALGGIIEALKAQPAVLALTVANSAMIVFMFYALNAAAKFRETLLTQQFEYQHKVNDLLSKCIVPDRRTGFGPRNVPLPKPKPTMDSEKPRDVSDPSKPEVQDEEAR